MVLHVSKTEIRRFLVAYHGLDERGTGTTHIGDYVSRVGCIQYDPLNVVGRNADLVLQARVADYRPEMLEGLLYTERRLVDGWDKMMAIYAAQDWPGYARIRLYRKELARRILQYRGAAAAMNEVDKVVEFLRVNGPSRFSGLELGNASAAGSWGPKKLSSAAFDYLFHAGTVGIQRKIGTQKVYDLMENLLPESLLGQPDPFPQPRDFHKWFMLRRIGAVGALWNKNSVLWQYLDDALAAKSYRAGLLAELVEEGKLVKLTVEAERAPFYLRQRDAGLFLRGAVASPAGKVRFLAPLDNLLWDRALIESLFGFAYRWEVYTPPAKRKYGYYVLPVLYGDRFVGRIEPLVDKKTRRLRLARLWFEADVQPDASLRAAIADELLVFAGFLGLDGVDDEGWLD